MSQQSDTLLILDDRAGRREAMRFGLRCTGTIGVLRAASARGLVDLSGALEKLQATNFRISPAIIRSLLLD